MKLLLSLLFCLCISLSVRADGHGPVFGLATPTGFDRISLLVHHCGSVPVHHTHQSLQLKCNRLKARVIIYAYHHVRLLPPEPLVVKQPQFTRVEGADIVMQSSLELLLNWERQERL